jgi:BMFP domain-containing protein YqiC
MPRSDYDAPAGIPREMLQDTLIDVMAENDRLRARIETLESQLAAERDALLSSASDVVGMDARIKELEAALMDVKHLTDPIIERARRALEKRQAETEAPTIRRGPGYDEP